MMASRKETPPRLNKHDAVVTAIKPVKPPGDDNDINSLQQNQGDIENDGVMQGDPPPCLKQARCCRRTMGDDAARQ